MMALHASGAVSAAAAASRGAVALAPLLLRAASSLRHRTVADAHQQLAYSLPTHRASMHSSAARRTRVGDLFAGQRPATALVGAAADFGSGGVAHDAHHQQQQLAAFLSHIITAEQVQQQHAHGHSTHHAGLHTSAAAAAATSSGHSGEQAAASRSPDTSVSRSPSSPPPPPSSGGTGGGNKSGGTGGDGRKPPEDPDEHQSYAHQAAAALVANLHLSSRARLRTIIAGVLAAMALGGVLIYVFRDPLKANLSVQTADVAKRSLTDENVQAQVNVLTADVVHNLLENPALMAQVLVFLNKVMAAPETRASVVQLLQLTANDPATLALMAKFAAALLADLMARPETLSQLTKLLRDAVTAPGNEQALQVLFKSFANEPATQQLVAELAKKAAMDVMRDEAVRAAAKDMIQNVTGDVEVQKSSGEAMWNAVKFAIKPSWFGGKHGHGHVAAGDAAAVQVGAGVTAGQQVLPPLPVPVGPLPPLPIDPLSVTAEEQAQLEQQLAELRSITNADSATANAADAPAPNGTAAANGVAQSTEAAQAQQQPAAAPLPPLSGKHPHPPASSPPEL